MDIRRTKAYKYAEFCVNNDDGKVPKYVKLQAAEWIAIANGERSYARISLAKCRQVKRILRLMVHPDLGCDMYEGLEPYAMLLIYAAFGTVKPDGSRLYLVHRLSVQVLPAYITRLHRRYADRAEIFSLFLSRTRL